MLDKLKSSVAIKVIVLYLCTLGVYHKIVSSLWRFVMSMVIFGISTILFNIPYNLSLFILLISVACAFTEVIFIRYMKSTWDYRHFDIINIPYWLIPLWAITIVAVIAMSNRFRELFM